MLDPVQPLEYETGLLVHDQTERTQRTKEQGWHSRLVRDLGAIGPDFDSRISRPCFDFFPYSVA